MRINAALAAGGLAIGANTPALSVADLIPLRTAHGGLLRLLVVLSGGALHPPAGAIFQAGFHIAVGLLMTLVYAVVLERLLPGPAWARGALYALAVWIANAALLLPFIGEGFAGSRYLSLAGIVWFAAAHTLFFVLAAILYDRFRTQDVKAPKSYSKRSA